MKSLHWTSRDVEMLPDDGKRYEVVDGDLYISRQPHLHHQIVCTKVAALLQQWSDQTQLGLPIFEPGVIFTDDNDVVPDVIWISNENDTLQSPLLPGFRCKVGQFFISFVR